MHFHHLHFYVRDVPFWRNWFVHKLAFCEKKYSAKAGLEQAAPDQPTVVQQGAIEIWLSGPGSALTPTVEQYLHHHPPGLVDVSFATARFDQTMARIRSQGACQLTEISLNADGYRQCQIQGWADLRHTLVEVSPQWAAARNQCHAGPSSPWLQAVDHVVLNVFSGELDGAADWYQRVFGLVTGQRFEISTAHSGLCSQVLVHPEGTIQLPINEPSSANSQIQEFLNHNRGAGIQHAALRSRDAVGAIAHFRQQGLTLISVPGTYYEQLSTRPDCPLSDTSAASDQQLLVDWAKGGQQGMLLQTFTKPIFAEPTFFFEIIERGTYQEKGQIKQAQGFGEGNFQALFEAIERAQAIRGSLH